MNEPAKPLRLFAAASIPTSELRRVEEATARLRDRLIGARWAPLENQHVTLKFLGSTERDRLDEVCEVISGVVAESEPAELSVGGLGTFPSARRARVLWAGVRDEQGVLRTVAQGLAERLAPLGYEPEKRSFTPHLTLARFRVPVPIDPAELQLEEGEPFRLDTVDLYRSHLSPKGARYEVVRSFALGAE